MECADGVGGTTADWGNGWIESHAALCAAAGKPCLFEECKSRLPRLSDRADGEDGYTTDHCGIESVWQDTSLAADGMAGDAFWQLGMLCLWSDWRYDADVLGDTLSYGDSHDDGHTIYYGSEDWTCLVTEHVADI